LEAPRFLWPLFRRGEGDGLRQMNPPDPPDDKSLHEALIPRDRVCIASRFA